MPFVPLLSNFKCVVSGPSLLSCPLFLLLAPIFLLQFVLPGASAEFDLSTKSGSKVCVGEICGESSIVHYYECCGQFYNDCCLRLQSWLIVVLLVAVIFAIVSFLIGLIKCICCCNRDR